MSRLNIFLIISFVAYLLIQVVILKNVVLFNSAFCFLYIGFLLLMPVDSTPLLLIAAGFLMGVFVDVFYDSLGLHAFSCVLIMYTRNYWLNLITPQGGYDSSTTPSLVAYGLQWFLVYTLPMVFIHHSLLFYIEAGGFGLFWFTLWKVLFSTLFTTLSIVIVQYLFPVRRRV